MSDYSDSFDESDESLSESDSDGFVEPDEPVKKAPKVTPPKPAPKTKTTAKEKEKPAPKTKAAAAKEKEKVKEKPVPKKPVASVPASTGKVTYSPCRRTGLSRSAAAMTSLHHHV